MEYPAGSVAGEAASAHARRRLYVRRDFPVVPFFWRGLLPLLGLLAIVAYGIGPFAHQRIEANVRHGVRTALDAQGMQWAKLEVSGQHIRLGGQAPASGAGELALAAARQAACKTWLGPRICAVSVGGQFDPPAADVALPSVQEQAEACEQRFAEAMSQAKIEFAVSSAVIRSASGPLLALLAEAHQQCPGVVVVAGHTDSIGDPAFNQSLSESRAAAVRAALIDLGVPADRLEAKGFGAIQPVADNNTYAGRAKNRRIEFRVVLPN